MGPSAAEHHTEASGESDGARSVPRTLVGNRADDIVRRTWPGWLALLVLLSTALDVIFFTGFFASDDIVYYFGGIKLLEGRLGPSIDLGETRLTMLAWNALAVAILGPHVQRVAASYILLHQLANVATFALGKRLFGPRAALVALYLLVMSPMMIIHAGTILPDIPSVLFMTLSLLAMLRAMPTDRDATVGTGRLVWMLLAGLLFGVSYGAKEPALIGIPVLVVWGVFHVKQRCAPRWVGRTLALMAAFAAGLLVFVALETAVFSSATDQLFLRLGWTVDDDFAPARGMVARHGTDPWKRAALLGVALDFKYLPAPYTALLIASLLAFPFLRGRPWWLWALTLWSFAYLTWGSVSPTRYSPPSIQGRYYIQVLPFAILIVGVVCTRGLQWLETRRLGLIAAPTGLALLVFPWLHLQGPNRLAGNIYHADVVHAGQAALAKARSTQPDVPVILADYLAFDLSPIVRGAADVVSSEALSGAELRSRLAAGPVQYLMIRPDELTESYRRRASLLDVTLDRALADICARLATASSGAAVLTLGAASGIPVRARWYEYRAPVRRFAVLGSGSAGQPRRRTNRAVWLVEIERSLEGSTLD